MTTIVNGTTGLTFPDGVTQSSGIAAPGASGNVLTSNGTSWTSAALSIPAAGQLQTQLFTSSGNWTCPTGVTKAKVTVIGGGGGSMFMTSYDNGGAGGSGGAVVATVNVTPATVYSITIGAGGVGLLTPNSGTASSGSTSSFSTLVTATGGAGGTGNTGTGTAGANGTGSTTGTALRVSPGISFLSASSGNYTSTAAFSFSATGVKGAGTGGVFEGTPSASGGASGAVLIEWVGV